MQSGGFTTIELIVTIAILAFGIVGVYTAFTPLFTAGSNSALRLTASYLAQEGLEIVRNMRDNNVIAASAWSSGLTSCAQGCQADYKTGTAKAGTSDTLSAFNASNYLYIDGDGFYSYGAATATPFTRDITITQNGTDQLTVDVLVQWKYNGKTYASSAKTILYNWH